MICKGAVALRKVAWRCYGLGFWSPIAVRHAAGEDPPVWHRRSERKRRRQPPSTQGTAAVGGPLPQGLGVPGRRPACPDPQPCAQSAGPLRTGPCRACIAAPVCGTSQTDLRTGNLYSAIKLAMQVRYVSHPSADSLLDASSRSEDCVPGYTVFQLAGVRLRTALLAWRLPVQTSS